MNPKRIPPLLATIAVMFASGCQADKNLYFTTYTKVGLHATSVGGQPDSVVFGYKRFEGALIPVDPETATGKPQDMASLYAAIGVTNGWLSGLKIKQVFATGAAAEMISTNQGGLLQ
jgi:hypothetical protein